MPIWASVTRMPWCAPVPAIGWARASSGGDATTRTMSMPMIIMARRSARRLSTSTGCAPSGRGRCRGSMRSRPPQRSVGPGDTHADAGDDLCRHQPGLTLDLLRYTRMIRAFAGACRRGRGGGRDRRRLARRPWRDRGGGARRRETDWQRTCTSMTTPRRGCAMRSTSRATIGARGCRAIGSCGRWAAGRAAAADARHRACGGLVVGWRHAARYRLRRRPAGR